MKIKWYKILERFFKFLNKTVLVGYNKWKWDKMTEVTGTILTYKDFDDLG